MNKILIYTESIHTRMSYVVHFIQQFVPDSQWVCVTSLTEYQSYQGISINYSNTNLKDHEYFIPYSGWLIADRNSYRIIPARNVAENFQIFPNAFDNNFDIFAAIFYVLAKIEEYLPFDEDVHGRFPGTQSILFKNGVLEIPIVDLWVIQFIHSLELKFKVKLIIRTYQPSWSLGIDIDHFYKYKHKPFIKKAGGLIRSFFKGDFKEFANRVGVHFLNQKDPYNSFEKFEQLNIKSEQLIFFILSGGNSKFDKNQPLHVMAIQKIVEELKRFAKIGLHPSYAALGHNTLAQEKKNLESCLGDAVEMSRQHFLRIRFPESYQQLLEFGIRKEYSLGYADHAGFRAGTCRPFCWYDLENEKETELLLYPLVAMDRCFLDYLKYKPEIAEEKIKKLFDVCMNVGGHFHLVWHNSSYDFEGEWKMWEDVLDNLIQYFKQQEI